MRVDPGAAEDAFHLERFAGLSHLRGVPLGGAQGGCGFLDPLPDAVAVVERFRPDPQQQFAGFFGLPQRRLDVIERILCLLEAEESRLVVLRAELDRGQIAGHGGLLVARLGLAIDL